MPPEKANYNPRRDARRVLRTHISDKSPGLSAASGENATSAAAPDQQAHQILPSQGENVPDYGSIQALIRFEGAERTPYLQNFVRQLEEAATSTPQPATQMTTTPLPTSRKRERSASTTDQNDELSPRDKSKPRRKILKTTGHDHDMAGVKHQTANPSDEAENEKQTQTPYPKPTSSHPQTKASNTAAKSNHKRKQLLKQLRKSMQTATNPQVEPASGTVTRCLAGDVYVALDKPGPNLRVGSEIEVPSNIRRTDSKPFDEGDRVRVWFQPSFCDKKVGQVCMVGHLWEGEDEE